MEGEEVGGEVSGSGAAALPAAASPVAGEPVAGEPVAGEPVAGEPVAGEPVAGEPVAGEPVAGGAVVRPVRARGTRDRSHQFPGRTRSVLVRYDDAEYAAVKVAAERAGLTATGYVAAAALATATGTTPPVPSLAREALLELMEARRQVVRFGTNVNQAAKAVNSGEEMPEWLERAVALTERAVAGVSEAATVMRDRLS